MSRRAAPIDSVDHLGDLVVTVHVDVTSLDTHNFGRDENIIQTYFEVDLFPEAM